MKDKIKTLDRKVVAFTIIAVLAFAGFALASPDSSAPAVDDTVVAQEETTEQGAEQEPAAEPEATEQDQPTAYEYVAQAGDSYSKIARKAVQTYGIVNDVSLSEAQIIYAETVLTRNAGAPLLNVGQTISMDEADVREVVESANELDEATKSLWAQYAVGVDFNTDSVGEAPQE